LIAFITIGHAYKGESAGASFEGHQEVTMVRRYVAALRARLMELGWAVSVSDKNRYSADKAAADAMGATVYLNCHLNAGMGGKDSQRGEIFYDYQTSTANGIALATTVARHLDDALPFAVLAKRCRPDTNGTPRDGDYSEAYGCIAGVEAVSLCAEPFFIDGAHRAELRADAMLDRIGVLIADGIDAWYEARAGR
jgi:N-acetylmuramoyl-L-alanine amidase